MVHGELDLLECCDACGCVILAAAFCTSFYSVLKCHDLVIIILRTHCAGDGLTQATCGSLGPVLEEPCKLAVATCCDRPQIGA